MFTGSQSDDYVRRYTAGPPRGLPADYEERTIKHQEQATKILFVGNSQTSWWAIPETVERLVNEGSNTLVRCYRSVKGGKGLSWHVDSSDAVERIANGEFDIVVLQGVYTEADQEAADSLSRAARDAGARTLMYASWPRLRHPLEVTEEIAERIENVAGRIGAKVVHVGRAWRTAREGLPGQRFYGADGAHAGALGSYLTACVFYAYLTGASPEGNAPATTLVGQVPIPERMARELASIAWRTVGRDNGRAGNAQIDAISAAWRQAPLSPAYSRSAYSSSRMISRFCVHLFSQAPHLVQASGLTFLVAQR